MDDLSSRYISYSTQATLLTSILQKHTHKDQQDVKVPLPRTGQTAGSEPLFQEADPPIIEARTCSSRWWIKDDPIKKI